MLQLSTLVKQMPSKLKSKKKIAWSLHLSHSLNIMGIQFGSMKKNKVLSAYASTTAIWTKPIQETTILLCSLTKLSMLVPVMSLFPSWMDSWDITRSLSNQPTTTKPPSSVLGAHFHIVSSHSVSRMQEQPFRGCGLHLSQYQTYCSGLFGWPSHSFQEMRPTPTSSRAIFLRCRFYKIHMNPHKCIFFVKFGHFLGFIVLKHEIWVDPNKVKVITQFLAPQSILQLPILQGKENFICHFIINYVKLTNNFMPLLKKGVQLLWDDQAQCSFDALKKALTLAPLMSPPTYTINFLL